MGESVIVEKSKEINRLKEIINRLIIFIFQHKYFSNLILINIFYFQVQFT